MLASTFLVSTLFGKKRIRAAVVGVVIALMLVVGSTNYEVRGGDTLSAIAAEHGVSIAAILAANDITDPDLIRVGQQIVIPGTDRFHTVQQGETLGQIASLYDSDAHAIGSLNSLRDLNLIQVGQRLTIPGGGGPSAGPTGFHVVAAGETLAEIAAKYGISVAALAEANGITDPSLVYVGTRLELSGDTYVAEPPATSTKSHTVAHGETLNGIAEKYGVGVGDLVAANDIADVNSIRVGQVLSIPGAGAGVWVCPVPGAQFVNDWGFPRPGGRFHEGNDLFAPRGTEVLAPVGGQIKLITGTIGGLQFRLYGDDDVTYIGTHLDGFGRSGRVEAGDVIGYVGDTGNARGGPPHLHFEMLPGDGAPTNPYPTLEANGCH